MCVDISIRIGKVVIERVVISGRGIKSFEKVDAGKQIDVLIDRIVVRFAGVGRVVVRRVAADAELVDGGFVAVQPYIKARCYSVVDVEGFADVGWGSVVVARGAEVEGRFQCFDLMGVVEPEPGRSGSVDVCGKGQCGTFRGDISLVFGQNGLFRKEDLSGRYGVSCNTGVQVKSERRGVFCFSMVVAYAERVGIALLQVRISSREVEWVGVLQLVAQLLDARLLGAGRVVGRDTVFRIDRVVEGDRRTETAEYGPVVVLLRKQFVFVEQR